MRAKSLVRVLWTLVASGALWATLGAPAVLAQTSDSAKVSDLLIQAKGHAALAAEDAATLQSYVNSTHSWESYSSRLSTMTEHVNALGRVNKQLADSRSEGSQWQQIAIDRIDPLLRDMAAQLTATLNHLKTHQSQVHMPPFRDYVQANYDYASRTSQMITDFVEYDKTKAKLHMLEQKLELPVTGD